MFNKKVDSKNELAKNIIYLTKNEIKKILKNRGFYIICYLLLINIFTQICLDLNIFEISRKEGDAYIAFLFNSNEVVILFSFFIIINFIKNKNFFKKSDKIKIFFSKIISIWLIIFVTEIIFIMSKIFINSIRVGFKGEYFNIIVLGIILKLIVTLAIITILITSMLIIRNNIIAIMVFIFIVNYGLIVSFVSKLMGCSINIESFSLINYFNRGYFNNLDSFFLIKGIIIGIIYIAIFIIIGVCCVEKDTLKITNIKLRGHKHQLLANIKFLIEIATYVHNEIFLKYKDNEREKEIVLDELKQIVKLLVGELEKYKNKEIKISELNKKYCICIDMYREINKEYPWVATFGLYEGYGFNYYKYFKSML
ncbi:MAG: hypothetical protein ACRDD2_14515 [Sarcina sp.]